MLNNFILLYLCIALYKVWNMKIIFSDNTLWGLLNFRGGVIRHFANAGHSVVLVAPRDELSDIAGLPPNVKYIPVRLDRRGTNPLSDIRYYKSLKKIYKSEKPDYIFHYTIKPNIYGTLAARSLGIRTTAIIAGLGYVYSKRSLVNSIAHVMYKYAMRYPEQVMVLNITNYNVLIERKVVKKEKLLFLEGGEGVNLEQFKPAPAPDNKRTVFLMISRLLYEKGYAEFAGTARKLKNEAEFRIMGPVYSHPNAVQRATIEADVISGAIRHIEFSSDVVSQIASADCIVLPSHAEGLSRVLMEALAMAKPIIATDIQGCRETVDEGKNGFICKPKDSVSLTEACKKFITLPADDRNGMGIASRRKAEKTFDEQIVINRYLELLEA